MSRRIRGGDVRIWWNDLFLPVANVYFRAQYLIRGGARAYGLKQNRELKDIHRGKRVFIVGNGPSVKEQDLRPLKDEICFFVNRGFMHPCYEIIQPTYHIIIDPKLGTGEWPLSFLDEIAEKNPKVTFLLNGAWYNSPEFQPYKEKYKIFWLYQSLFLGRFFCPKIDLTKIGVGGAVAEQCILASIYMRPKDIYLIGVDYNGIGYDFIKRSSHFYGSNPENLTKEFHTIALDLDMASTSFRQFELIASLCQRQGVNLINLTKGGVLDVCPRMNYEDVIAK